MMVITKRIVCLPGINKLRWCMARSNVINIMTVSNVQIKEVTSLEWPPTDDTSCM